MQISLVRPSSVRGQSISASIARRRPADDLRMAAPRYEYALSDPYAISPHDQGPRRLRQRSEASPYLPKNAAGRPDKAQILVL